LEGTTAIKSVFWIGTFVMLFFAFILFFLVLFYKNYFFRMKQQEAESLLKASLESEKKERERIAADLHDSVSSDLSAIRNFLAVILKTEEDDERKSIFNELKLGVEHSIENTRLISYKLAPPLLDKFGFVIALENYFTNLTKKTNCNFCIQCSDDFICLTEHEAYELFRVVQEFTTNMLKYGSITTCLVICNVNDNMGYIEVIDDGVSYDFEKKLTSSEGTGLKNINSRLKVIGASLLQSKVLQGNHFVISIWKK
jgi:signal transduction histidine kinase